MIRENLNKGMLLLTGLLITLSSCFSQYYTPAQINTIHTTKASFEGDMYLDTINKDYYIGLTNGILAKIGDIHDEQIDSLYLQGDSVILQEGGKQYVINVSNLIDSFQTLTTLQLIGDTLKYKDENDATTKIYVGYLFNRIAEIIDTGALQVLTSTFANVTFGDTSILDIGFSRTSNSITVTNSGTYKITYRVTAFYDEKKGGKETARYHITINGVEKTGTKGVAFCHHKELDYATTISVHSVVRLNAGDVIRVRARRTNTQGYTSLKTLPHGSSLTVERF